MIESVIQPAARSSYLLAHIAHMSPVLIEMQVDMFGFWRSEVVVAGNKGIILGHENHGGDLDLVEVVLGRTSAIVVLPVLKFCGGSGVEIVEIMEGGIPRDSIGVWNQTIPHLASNRLPAELHEAKIIEAIQTSFEQFGTALEMDGRMHGDGQIGFDQTLCSEV